jgi:hypothetical protein
MTPERRRLLLGYSLTVVGLVVAYLVVASIPNVPGPPACSTGYCDAADVASLIGLFLILAGIVTLTLALFRGGTDQPAGPPGWSGSSYSFAPPVSQGEGSPTGPVPPASPAPLSGGPTALTRCPACNAPVTAEYGFCPRCGHTLAP